MNKPTRKLAMIIRCTATALLLTLLAMPFQAPFAATGDSVVLTEAERTQQEREFLPLLERNNRIKALKDYYPALTPKLKNVVANAYNLMRDKGLDEKKLAMGTGMVTESMYGIVAARILVKEWTTNRKRADLEITSIATRLKPIIRQVPEMAALFDMAELEELDRLQMEVLNAVIAESEKRTAEMKKETAEMKKEIAKLQRAIKRLEALLGKH